MNTEFETNVYSIITNTTELSILPSLSANMHGNKQVVSKLTHLSSNTQTFVTARLSPPLFSLKASRFPLFSILLQRLLPPGLLGSGITLMDNTIDRIISGLLLCLCQMSLCPSLAFYLPTLHINVVFFPKPHSLSRICALSMYAFLCLLLSLSLNGMRQFLFLYTIPNT